MAVTYAWRLDANKYAYIINPETLENGYAINYPATKEEIKIIAKEANLRFGEDSETAFEDYVTAFNDMLAVISETWSAEWPDVSAIDLLTADVYYNVDSPDCADLRGVGIKGIKYLGGFRPTDSGENIDWSTTRWDSGIPQGESGTYSVYGVFTEDMDIEETNISPSNFFTVYNGTNGVNGKDLVDDGTFATKEELQSEIYGVKADILLLNNDINELRGVNVGGFASANSLNELKSQVDKIEELLNQLNINLMELIDRVNDLETAVENTEIPTINVTERDTNNLSYVLMFNPEEAAAQNDRSAINVYYTKGVQIQSDAIHTANGFYEDVQ